MKTLTLNLKRIYFNQILSGEKTHEYRDIFPENAKKFVYYTMATGPLLPMRASVGGGVPGRYHPASGQIQLHQVPHRCLLRKAALYGCRSQGRPDQFHQGREREQIIVLDEATGIEFVAAQLDYTLGKIVEVSD